MGYFSGLMQAFGERRVQRRDMPYRPWDKLPRKYEDVIANDIIGRAPGQHGLYSSDPYGDQGLGYSSQEMQGIYGQGRDVLSGEAAAENQALNDRFRSPGGLGLQSAMYARARQREDLARVTRANQLREDMIVKNAAQKRADKMARLAAVTGAYQDIVGIYNYRQAAKAASDRAQFAGSGKAMDSIASAAAGGMM